MRGCRICPKKSRLMQKLAFGADAPVSTPKILNEVLSTPGHPLGPGSRRILEPHFAHDLRHVRIHSDARASESAASIGARAYTYGSHIVFGNGEFLMENDAGIRLLAHELVHTVQQSAARGGSPSGIEENDAPEAEADQVSRGMTSDRYASPSSLGLSLGRAHSIQRKVVVDDPGTQPASAPAGETNEKIVKDYVATLCPDFTVRTGEVVPNSPSSCSDISKSSAPASCKCLCDMHALIDQATGSDVTWSIDVNDNDWPHTDPSTRTVTVHSPLSGVEFGAWARGAPPHRSIEPNWLVLGHELCGHAALFASGTHPTGPSPTHGGRPSHDATVEIENKISAEHGIPASDLRGLFADPHHGESFAKVTVSQFPLNSADIASLPASERHNLDIAEAFIKSAPVKMDVVRHADTTGT